MFYSSDLTDLNPYDYSSYEEWLAAHEIDPDNITGRNTLIAMGWDRVQREKAYRAADVEAKRQKRLSWEALSRDAKVEILRARAIARANHLPLETLEPKYFDEFYPYGEDEARELLSSDPTVATFRGGTLPRQSLPADFDWDEILESGTVQSPESVPESGNVPDLEDGGDSDLDIRQRQALAEGLPPEELPADMDPSDYYDFKARYNGLPWSEIDSSGQPIRRLPRGVSASDLDD